MQIKVNDTRMHKVKDAFCQVAEGKLLLVPIFYNGKINPGVIELDKRYLQPSIISETEVCEAKDRVYNEAYGIGTVVSRKGTTGSYYVVSFESKSGNTATVCNINKVIALPEHFSPRHLQAIVDGKMKDGDKVLVECESVLVNHSDVLEGEDPIHIYHIKLNSSNHITLHKLEEPMYKENKILKVLKQIAEEHIPISFRKEAVIEWLKEME